MLITFEPDVEALLREAGAAARSAGCEAWVVGGAVRDAILGRRVTDIDITVVGNAVSAVAALQAAWSARTEQYEAFSTATLVRPDGYRVDFVRARSETYERSGALPTVAPGNLASDLARRDFTVNAMAASLAESDFGTLIDHWDGYDDLERRVLRVLHEGSFIDDPTRLFRAARYAVRLGLEPDLETDRLAGQAVGHGATATVSGDRLRREVELILGEGSWTETVAWLNRWGLWSAMASGWEPSPISLKRIDVVHTWAERSFGEPPPTRLALRWLLLLASAPPGLSAVLGAKPADAAAAERARRVLASADGPDGPDWWRAMDAEPLGVLLVALAMARNDADKQRLTSYLTDIRGTRLSITGDDLVRAGAKPAPAMGRALERTLDALREHRVRTGAEQLEHALQSIEKESGQL